MVGVDVGGTVRPEVWTPDGHWAAAPAGGPMLPGGTAKDPAQERDARHPACPL